MADQREAIVSASERGAEEDARSAAEGVPARVSRDARVDEARECAVDDLPPRIDASAWMPEPEPPEDEEVDE